eukprot:m.259500 g.259500  ORF g.259500 m.259500 type:complete len:721 (+) comp22550_c0_seq1:55-2217(+)
MRWKRPLAALALLAFAIALIVTMQRPVSVDLAITEPQLRAQQSKLHDTLLPVSKITALTEVVPTYLARTTRATSAPTIHPFVKALLGAEDKNPSGGGAKATAAQHSAAATTVRPTTARPPTTWRQDGEKMKSTDAAVTTKAAKTETKAPTAIATTTTVTKKTAASTAATPTTAAATETAEATRATARSTTAAARGTGPASAARATKTPGGVTASAAAVTDTPPTTTRPAKPQKNQPSTSDGTALDLMSTTTSPTTTSATGQKTLQEQLIEKYGSEGIVRPTTWTQLCLSFVMPDEQPVEEVRAKFGFDLHNDSQYGAAILHEFDGSRGDRASWTESWGIRSARAVCLDVSGVGVGEPVRATGCVASANQTWEYRTIGAWRQFGLIRNPASNMCLYAPSSKRTDRRITLRPCPDEEDLYAAHMCPFAWVMTAEIPKGLTRPAAAEVPEITGAVPTKYIQRLQTPQKHRLLCFIMAMPQNFATKGAAVNRTWGRECDILLFFSTELVPGYNVIKSPIEGEDRDLLWRKAQHAWLHVARKFADKADFFVRADDDTYINMDNLRALLEPHDPDGRLFIGRLLYPEGVKDEGFYSGGSSIIASRGTMVHFAKSAAKNRWIFGEEDTFADDLEISLTMARIGINPVDTLDAEGRNLFHTLGVGVERSLTRKKDPSMWLWTYSPSAIEGMSCCSKRWISSHYTSPPEMYMLDDLHALGCEAAGEDPY